MSKKRLCGILFLAVAVLFMFTACGSGSSSGGTASRDKMRLSIGTASLGSNYYLCGTTIGQVFSKYIDNFEMIAEVTNGSGVNYGLVETKTVDIGLTINNVAYNAWQGKGFGIDKPMQDVRTIAALMPSSLCAYGLASNNSINTFSDLTGKAISPGTSGSGGDMVLKDVLAVLTEVKPALTQYMGVSDINNQIQDQILDVFCLFAGFPSATVLEIEASAELKFIPMTAEQRKRVVNQYHYFFEGTEPPGTYKNTPKDGYPTIMTPNILVGHKDLPEDIGYQMAKLIYDKLDELIVGASSFQHVNKESVLTSAIPLHPGAVRYFKEIGYTIPDSLIPPEMK